MTARTATYEGGCLCGHIRFEARGTPQFPHTCSCRMCQRHSGAPTTAWVVFPEADVAWTGPGGRPATYRSSAAFQRTFCPRCGSTMGCFAEEPLVGLMVASFDRPGLKALRPTGHLHRGSRPRWWHFEVDTA